MAVLLKHHGLDGLVRLLMAVLLKHHGLDGLVVRLLSADNQSSTEAPRCLVDVCKVVHQARTSLIKVLRRV